MKVSIIIPTFNREQWIKKCLDSIFAQDYPKDKFEVIVVDDNSTDRTVEIVNKYVTLSLSKGYLPLKLLTSGFKDPEKSKAIGLTEATGDLIYFGDSDVVLQTPNWITEMVRPFQENPDIFASECNWGIAPDFTSINAYCALLGIADPLARMLSNRKPETTEHKQGYDLLRFKHGDNPILFCPLWRADYVRSILSNGLFLEANAPMKMIAQGHTKLAHVHTVEAYHYYVTTLSDYLKKRSKILGYYLERVDRGQEQWTETKKELSLRGTKQSPVVPPLKVRGGEGGVMNPSCHGEPARLALAPARQVEPLPKRKSFFSALSGVLSFKFLFSVVYLSTGIGPLFESLFQFAKTKRKEWLWHPVVSFLTVIIYTKSYLSQNKTLLSLSLKSKSRLKH